MTVSNQYMIQWFRKATSGSHNAAGKVSYGLTFEGSIDDAIDIKEVEANTEPNGTELSPGGEPEPETDENGLPYVKNYYWHLNEYGNYDLLATDEFKAEAAEKGYGVAEWYSGRGFESTGDDRTDGYIERGIAYRDSCFDITNLPEFAEITSQEDFTGMTDGEIYKAIYEKYQYCYGENFLDATALSYISPRSEYDFTLSTIDKFNAEVERTFGNAENAAKARVEALYGSDLTDSEIVDAIIEKYKSSDNTYLDIIKMANEMENCGINVGLRKKLDPIGQPGVFYSVFDNKDDYDYRDSILDSTNVTKYLKTVRDSYRSDVSFGRAVAPGYGAVLGQLLNAYGLSL